MREILFRGKDLQEQNGWIYGYFYKSDINKRERESGKATLIFTPNCDTFIYCPEYHNSLMVKAETIGQYTGMTDKNGNKIFEGDIISTSSKLIGAVEWNNTFAKYIVCYNQISGNWFDFEGEDCFSVALDCVIIGNIHDNPELMEVNQNG